VVPLILRSVDYGYAIIWQELHPSFFVFQSLAVRTVWGDTVGADDLDGATLPVLAAVLLRAPRFKSTSVTRLYTYNLAGAIIGTVAAGFLLLPTFGLHKTIYLAAAMNFLIGVVAVLVDARTGAAGADSAFEKSGNDVREGIAPSTLPQQRR